jgi:carbon monoxide dehydrogenase subunit G
MASINLEKTLAVSPDAAWAVLSRTDRAHEAFPDVLASCQQQGDLRTVTFANGAVVKERIVDVDPARRRIAYGVVEGRFTHHSAAMQIVEDGEGRSRFIWTADFLPAEAAAMVGPLMEQGAEAFARTVEKVTA